MDTRIMIEKDDKLMVVSGLSAELVHKHLRDLLQNYTLRLNPADIQTIQADTPQHRFEVLLNPDPEGMGVYKFNLNA